MKAKNENIKKLKIKILELGRYFQREWDRAEHIDRKIQELKQQDITRLQLNNPTRFH